uniref:Protein V57 n=1 Tax=Canid alphaherpesvirus 1 TaxID=170325 RepID=A0A172DSG5_9ALPH|nr:protein V57 [Canid alphaherpesvirus 1]
MNVFGSGRVATAEDYRKFLKNNKIAAKKLLVATSELKQSRRKSVNSNSYSTEKLGDASELKQSRRKSVNSNSYSTEKLGDASELKQSRRKSVNSNSSLTLLGLNKPPQRFYEKDNPRPRSKSQINASEDLHFYNQESPIRKKSFTNLKSVNTNDTVVISKPRKSIKKQYN